MPDAAVSKDRQFTFDCHDTVHCIKFSHLEFLTDLLAIGTTIRLTVVRCTAKVLHTLKNKNVRHKFIYRHHCWQFDLDH